MDYSDDLKKLEEQLDDALFNAKPETVLRVMRLFDTHMLPFCRVCGAKWDNNHRGRCECYDNR